MDILLFGATGRAGSRFLERALADEHRVTAFVRDSSGLPTGVSTIEGDVTDPEAVAATVPGHDAVVSAVGPADSDDTAVLTEGVANIVDAMETTGVDRLVAVGAAGILQATPQHLRLDTPEFPIRFRDVAAAHRSAYGTIRASGLNWTLVCPPVMPDGGPTNYYRTTTAYLPDGGQSVSSGDVAACVYDVLAEDSHHGERVGIAY
ncbi:SDR family oxidoreductase [Halomicroarcula sp. GCM10025709]|uniref:NAD(P)-dependent oxidoreductase n=1 Tax=Haloarcula TaxID=2237 RepID=UPI0024C40602|nr:SDR family oxidoreductase [Halomicroarcula sp. YJ-61-S]